MSAQVSIIIPAYNAEAGLEKSVRSVLSQTLQDIEVWIVNDGSKDSTGAIADALARHDQRVHVIHQMNCGCYQARLAALKRITTPYFGFVDADDLIEPDMYEAMVSFAKQQNLDVVRCSYDGEKDLGIWNEDDLVLDGKDSVVRQYVIPALIRGICGGTFVWNKLYRHQYDFSLFDPTDKDTTFEDMIFNLQFFTKVERMGFISRPLYHYIVTDSSSVSNYTEKTFHDFKECIRVRRNMLPHYGVQNTGRFAKEWFSLNRLNGIKAVLKSRRLNIKGKILLLSKLLLLRA